MFHFSAPGGIAISGSEAALSESLGAGRAVAPRGKTGGRRPNGHQSNIGAGLVNMHRVRNAATVIGVALLASLLLFPPFAVIDLAAARPRHAALGHYPRWRPPTPAMAEHVLTGLFGPPSPGAQTSLQIRVNRVRLGLEMTVAAVAALAVWMIERRYRRTNE